jgi:hypothetical protein
MILKFVVLNNLLRHFLFEIPGTHNTKYDTVI